MRAPQPWPPCRRRDDDGALVGGATPYRSAQPSPYSDSPPRATSACPYCGGALAIVAASGDTEPSPDTEPEDYRTRARRDAADQPCNGELDCPCGSCSPDPRN